MRAYPEYRESGVEWFATVPAGWETKRLRHMAQLQTEKATTSDNQIALENIEGWSGRIIETESEFSGDGVAFESGDILFGKLRPYLAKVALAEGHGAAVGDFHVLRPLSDMLPRFLQYLLLTPSVISIIDGSTYGSKMPRVSWDFMADLRLPVPSLAEQRAIADFLDREVAKIDALIEESRALIAALAEKRQATISHAVTRGLNPAARLKPSGVDWLGDIPEGWGMVRICFIARFTGGGTPARDQLEFWGGNIPWVSPKDMKVRHISSTEETITEEGLNNSAANLINAGSALLVVRSGILKHTIPVAIADVPVSINQDIRAAVFDRDCMSAKFFVYFVEGYNDALLVLWRKQGATVESIEHQYLANSPILLPTLKEQEAIVTYLDAETARLDALTGEAEAAIALLQERRAALISAAVTGKIDVREVARVPAHDSQFLHVSAMVAGVIIARHGQHLGFGRMMIQKFLFMTQACANAPEIGGDYERQAAGPLDRVLQNRVEAALEAAGLVRVRQEGGPGSRVQYEFLGDGIALRAKLAAALGDRMERFDYLSNQLGSLTKNGIEAVSTLYAAWNDFLIDGRTPDRADIIREVLENWHPEKPTKFTADELGNWLDWMERQNIVPDGTGPQTQTGRLFP